MTTPEVERLYRATTLIKEAACALAPDLDDPSLGIPFLLLTQALKDRAQDLFLRKP